MAQFDFTVQENGYSISEVDRYIQLLQAEYRNAVEWGREMEQKAGEAGEKSSSDENETLKEEIKRLTSDCRTLASKLREFMQSADSERTFKEAEAKASCVIEAAQEKAAQVIEKAEKECASIIADAESRVETLKKEIAILNKEKSGLAKDVNALGGEKESILSLIKKAEAMFNA